MPTVAETIRAITKEHIENRRGLVFGQCLSAVGWVANSVPEMQPCINPSENGGLVELPTCDVAGPHFVVGVALTGRRPIMIVRYQGFMVFNAAAFTAYARCSKEMWGVPCPVFIRAVGMEGGMGPSSTGIHHSVAMRVPGIRVAAPMTPNEYRAVWDDFMAHDDPYYCSEHRLSFPNDQELPDQPWSHDAPGSPDVILIGISAGRLSVVKAAALLTTSAEVGSSVHHIVNLKPYEPTAQLVRDLRQLRLGGFGLVVDSDHAACGAAEHVAHRLMLETNKKVYVLGLGDRTAGFADRLDNRTPTPEQIMGFVREKLK